jgi:DNA-binding NarL/FixJ family response regulator
MCGIVGYIGKQKASAIILEGLKRLEYRGYDSAGVATQNGDRFELAKKIGRVEGLIKARSNGHTGPLAELTPREQEILSFVARGHSNQAIADELFLTKRAVEKHINAIFMKLGLAHQDDVSRRVKAALIYLAGVEASGSAPV